MNKKHFLKKNGKMEKNNYKLVASVEKTICTIADVSDFEVGYKHNSKKFFHCPSFIAKFPVVVEILKI